MLALTVQYSLFIYLAAIGIVQMAAAHAGLRGLLLTSSRWAAVAVGVLFLTGSFSWFFGILDRNVRGLEGMEQGLLFVPASIAAVASTALASSLLHRLRRSRAQSRSIGGGRPRFARGGRPRGLEVLRSMTYIDALFEEDEGPVK